MEEIGIINSHQDSLGNRVLTENPTVSGMAMTTASGIDLTTNEISPASERKVAYTISPYKFFKSLEIRHSKNAWWMERDNIVAVMISLRLGHTIKTACSLIGITTTQFKYFEKMHPEFKAIKQELKLEPFYKAVHKLENSGAKSAKNFIRRLNRRKSGYKPVLDILSTPFTPLEY